MFASEVETPQDDIEIPKAELLERVEALQDRLVDGLKSRPEVIHGSTSKFVKGPGYPNEIVIEEAGISYILSGYRDGTEQRFYVSIPDRKQHLEIIHNNESGNKRAHLTFNPVYEFGGETKPFKDTPRAFREAEASIGPLLGPKKA